MIYETRRIRHINYSNQPNHRTIPNLPLAQEQAFPSVFLDFNLYLHAVFYVYGNVR